MNGRKSINSVIGSSFGRAFGLLAIVFCLGAAPVSAQDDAFPYPVMPDSLHEPQARADYALMHYWDNANFADSTLLYAANYGEQGFVNFIDLLNHFGKNVGEASARQFINKAWTTGVARRRFATLIDYYLEDNDSPVHNDRTYAWLLSAAADNPNTGATDRERYRFKAKQAAINQPGDTARDFSFKGDDGRMHRLSDYRDQRVCLFFYDPDCEQCHTTWAWLQANPLPADMKVLRIRVNDALFELYALKATPTMYLLDKGNVVVLKEATKEQLATGFTR